jgi:hypothetical protein
MVTIFFALLDPRIRSDQLAILSNLYLSIIISFL